MLGVLEVAFRRHAIARAGGVAAKLEVFFEQLLRGATDAHIRPGAVEDVVAIERCSARLRADLRTAAAAAAAAIAAAMIAAAHTLHVHASAIANSPVRRKPRPVRCLDSPGRAVRSGWASASKKPSDPVPVEPS